MKGKPILKILLGVLAIGYLVLIFTDFGKASGYVLVGFFLLLAYLVQGSTFSGFAYTIIIFAAVSASMYFPHWFIAVGDFQLSRLIVPLLMIIMFGMGTSMSWSDFKGVVKMPQAVGVGVVCQFTIMPIIGFGLAKLSGLPPEIAAGIVLVGCSPSGLASNVMSFLSNANLALSVTLTAVATLLSPLVTPFLMGLLADQFVPIDFLAMFWSIVKMVILPILAGLIFNHFAHGKLPWLDKAMPVISMAGIALIITIITAAGRDSLLSIGLVLIAVVVLHNLAGYLLGYWSCKLIGLDKKSCRTIAFEVGMQNSGLASGLALEMGKVTTMGLAPAVFGPFMNISGSSLATWWRGRDSSEAAKP
ncbi:MAG: bile acid:sodium symporter family protein [Cyclobacteriaceae bacterium]